MAILTAHRTVIAGLLASAVIVGALRGDAAQSPLTDAQAKAGFLYNCAMFIEWPEGAVRGGEIVVGVAGDDAVVTLISDMQGRKVNGRVIRVKAVRPNDDPHDLQILFLGDDLHGSYALLARIGDAPILTIGEQADFTSKGGVIRLYTEQERLRFEINMTRAERAGLRVSAKMLGLARIVR
jgi:hypothetical protein